MDWIVEFLGGVVDGLLGGVGDLLGVFFSVLEGIAAGLIGLVGHLLDLLPVAGDLGLPDLSGFVVAYSWLNTFLPVSEGVAAMVIYLAAANAGLVWQIGVRVYHLIPKPGMGT